MKKRNCKNEKKIDQRKNSTKSEFWVCKISTKNFESEIKREKVIGRLDSEIWNVSTTELVGINFKISDI